MKALAAALILASSSLACAAEFPTASIDGLFGRGFDGLGLQPQEKPLLPAPPPPVPAPTDEQALPPEEQRTNFKYGEISQRLKKIVIGRGKGRKAAAKKTWPMVADRVEKGEIKFIVVHSAMGSCAGAIDQMETHHAAAHFIVCKDGSVTRLVDIKNITLHVKNQAVNAASVGIETETGETVRKGKKTVSRFLPEDWDPNSRWRMYSSLAWLIRAVAEEAKVPRAQWGDKDSAGIIGHLDADSAIPDGHSDPGPDFYGRAYPAFEQRFPGQSMTPQKYLMMLVNEDTPPKIVLLTRPGSRALRISDSARAGVAKVVLEKMNGTTAVVVQTVEVLAASMPPAQIELPVPAEPGSYRVIADDLVGNRTAARFTVDPAAAALKLEVASAP